MKKKSINNQIAVYQAKTGAIMLKSDLARETIWATQAQIVQIFEIDQSVVSRHINNIFQTGEVDRKSNMQKMHIANSDKPAAFYSLDMILAVGYRANSAKAIIFRKWATKVLGEHITKGYTINPRAIKNHYAEFQKAVENIKGLLPPGANIDRASVLELVSAFADTWLSLEAYDKDKLTDKGVTRKSVALTAERLEKALAELKVSLIAKKQASDLFGRKKQNDVIAGIVGNVMQSFGGQPLYPTVEEKAAHLLYFMVKNHPFVDGNKRSGAYAFIWFLSQAGILDRSKISPAALTALTLFIAESEPKNKDRMIRLVLQLLKKA